jgi:hypothetical protein
MARLMALRRALAIMTLVACTGAEDPSELSDPSGDIAIQPERSNPQLDFSGK